MKYVLATLGTFLSISALAKIDMKNANFADTWLDITAPGTGYNLRMQRTYSSRSLFSGITGYGWCSDYETTIIITNENNIKLTECGGGAEITYMHRGQTTQSVAASIKEIIEAYKKQRNAKSAELKDLQYRLENDDYMRSSISTSLGLKGKVSLNKVYLANGKEEEQIVYDGKFYTRTLRDGTKQRFDQNGLLDAMYDKNQNYLKIKRSGEKILYIADNNGRRLNFQYKGNRLYQIVGPGNVSATYTFDGENLVQIKNMYGNTFKYKYDKLHNLLRIDFPDKTYKELTYNNDRDWVTSFRNRKGCVEKYDYKLDPKDPYSYHKSSVIKTCNEKVVNKSSYEFWYKDRPDGIGKYLDKAKTDNNGRVVETKYHPLFGTPLLKIQDGQTTTYTYYDNGFLKTKSQKYVYNKFWYKNECNKLSKVETDYYARRSIKGKTKRVKIKTISTNFKYTPPKCNLDYASNSDGMQIRIGYDSKGRIQQLKDQAKKKVVIGYNEQFGKPNIITRPGLGSIALEYRPDGTVGKIDSKDGLEVSRQVVNVFNNYLEILAPATNELSL